MTKKTYEDRESEARVFWNKIIEECGGTAQALRMLGSLFQGMPSILVDMLTADPEVMDRAKALADDHTLEEWAYVGPLAQGGLEWLRRRHGLLTSFAGAQVHRVEGILLGEAYTATVIPNRQATKRFYVGKDGQLQDDPFYFETDHAAKVAADRALLTEPRQWIVLKPMG